MEAGQRPTHGLPAYVLVTPARNEASLLEFTIRAVVAQTVRPLRWVIVSDGSTDGTDTLVSLHAEVHDWIELVRMPLRAERHFGGKALAIRAGLERLKGLDYDVVACLDADITFEPDYFEFLLGKLASDSELGIVGTPYRDATSEIYDYRFVSVDNVSGACQLFRRACYEEIGGYVVARGGAIDTIACLSARMKGWKTRTFTERTSSHHRAIGTAQHGPIASRFNLGKRDYAIGNHPLWEVLRGAYQMTRRPFVLRGLALIAGYLWAAVTRADRPASPEVRAFRRKEQMNRLAAVFFGRGFSAPRSGHGRQIPAKLSH
ncbi:glycosyltransferase family 2 protein [Acidobacteria bacterium AB60]|nr:glycosyltransferase family 2 protein [Acidobacteria bacterium AB60]